MNSWVKYYFEAIDRITLKEIPPYYLDSKVRDLSIYLSEFDKGKILSYILAQDNPSEHFRYFNKNKALKFICWPLDNLRRVPQDKGKSKNAFEHTLKVIESVPKENVILRWVALFHDLGKYDSHRFDGNFRKHQIYSYEIAVRLGFVYGVEQADKISNIVKNHMFPLDYQRNPNWTNKAIKRLIKRVGEEDILDTVLFSYHDKKSENNVKEYLEIIDELYYKIDKMLEEGI